MDNISIAKISSACYGFDPAHLPKDASRDSGDDNDDAASDSDSSRRV